MRRSRLFLAVAILAATAVLVGLGVWQLQRLAWKEALIESIGARIDGPVASLAQVESDWTASRDVDYQPVVVTGQFRHDLEQYFYTTREGTVGWDVFTPMILGDGRAVIVNRGFVPDARRDPATRAEGQVAGEQTVEGLARNPLAAKPNRFVPDNEPANRTYFWRDVVQMELTSGIAPATYLPFSVDARAGNVPGGLPAGGSTIVSLPNNHLQYAFTWFGLAAACLGVGAALLLRRKDPDS